MIKLIINLMIKFMINLMISLIIKLNLKGPDHQHVDVVAFPRVLVVAVSPHGHLEAAHIALEDLQKTTIVKVKVSPTCLPPMAWVHVTIGWG